MEAEELRIQLFDTFTPEDAMFGPESMLHLDHSHSHRVAHSKESLSFDTVAIYIFLCNIYFRLISRPSFLFGLC